MRVKVSLCIFLTMSVVSCSISGKASKSSYFAPPTFTDADLVGLWEVVYGGTYNDSITFRSDGTFQQVFTTNYGYSYTSPWNKWQVERRPSGCIYIHLTGMRYYMSTVEKAEAMSRGITVPLLEPCEDKFLIMSYDLILIVVNVSSLPRGIGLGQLRPDHDTNDKIFKLISSP